MKISITNTRKLYGIAGALVTLAVPYLIMLSNDAAHLEHSQSLCPFKMLTGFPCPGCGITKSIIFLYDGNIVKSISYHIFGPLVVAFCLVIIAALTTSIFTGKVYFNNILYNKRLAYFLAIFLAVYHLFRLYYFISGNSLDSILRESIWK
jgi:hypothetical protein